MSAHFGSAPIPTRVGIGLRSVHYRELLEQRPPVGWLEAHAENYFGDGGQPLYFLERLRAEYPLSLHGVGLSPGSTDALNLLHLNQLKVLCERYQPGLISEHLCWNVVDGQHLNDLLPLPYTEEALTHVTVRISRIQDLLGRQILIENLSSYLRFKHSTIPEWEFLMQVARRSGCGILLDINNIYVNACNHGFDAVDYLQAIDSDYVQEFHLAGFEQCEEVLIDTHGKPVSPAVWRLYREALRLLGCKPSLIEWDTDVPQLHVLLAEADQAQSIMDRYHDQAA